MHQNKSHILKDTSCMNRSCHRLCSFHERNNNSKKKLVWQHNNIWRMKTTILSWKQMKRRLCWQKETKTETKTFPGLILFLLTYSYARLSCLEQIFAIFASQVTLELHSDWHEVWRRVLWTVLLKTGKSSLFQWSLSRTSLQIPQEMHEYLKQGCKTGWRPLIHGQEVSLCKEQKRTEKTGN